MKGISKLMDQSDREYQGGGGGCRICFYIDRIILDQAEFSVCGKVENSFSESIFSFLLDHKNSKLKTMKPY